MGTLLMVDNSVNCPATAKWPLFYSNDFSIMGMRVGQLPEAVDILRSGGFEVMPVDGSAKVFFAGLKELHAIMGRLSRFGIPYSLTDLIDEVYQG